MITATIPRHVIASNGKMDGETNTMFFDGHGAPVESKTLTYLDQQDTLRLQRHRESQQAESMDGDDLEVDSGGVVASGSMLSRRPVNARRRLRRHIGSFSAFPDIMWIRAWGGLSPRSAHVGAGDGKFVSVTTCNHSS